jgi:hypothetical protein
MHAPKRVRGILEVRCDTNRRIHTHAGREKLTVVGHWRSSSNSVALPVFLRGIKDQCPENGYVHAILIMNLQINVPMIFRDALLEGCIQLLPGHDRRDSELPPEKLQLGP